MAGRVELGHREIVHVTGPSRYMHEQRRWEYMQHQAAAHGITVRKLGASYTVDSGQEATARLLAAPEPPRAIP